MRGPFEVYVVVVYLTCVEVQVFIEYAECYQLAYNLCMQMKDPTFDNCIFWRMIGAIN